MKNEKGITLIALVITVIIMLILAGVAISALTGDGGLFDKTLKSAEAFENAAQKEAKQLDELMNEIDGYIGNITTDKKAPSVAKLEVSNIIETGFTLTATGKDNVGISKYEFYIKNDDGTFTLEKTIESEDTTVTYDVTGKTPNQKSYVYKLKVYDKAGNSKESSEFLVEPGDTVAPTVAKLEVSNITETGFTLTATGEDDKGIAKYEIYIKNDDGTFTLEKTIESADTTVSYEVTGKTMKENSYTYKLKVYDRAENSKESNEITFGTKKVANVVSVGDYINYDAGVWTADDLTKITNSSGTPTVHSTVKDAITGNQAQPTEQGQFGGFEIGQSRNINSLHYGTYKPRTSGWRVWSIDKNTEIVTLISAGITESYYTATNRSSESVNILKNRDCTMYVNNHAIEAHILTGQEVATWYNDIYKTNYTIIENGESTSTTFYGKTFSQVEPISVLENGSHFWLATAHSSKSLYCIGAQVRHMGDFSNDAFPIRILISLKIEALLEQGTGGNGSLNDPWKLVKM